METTNNLFVYKDENYPTGFISESLITNITTKLTDNGFKLVNANSLKEEMLALVENKKKNTVIIFAQDVVPDTILDDNSASALIRRFLDCGGSIIWLGDIPCYYKGLRERQLENIFMWGAPTVILGVMPFFGDISIRPCSINKKGKKFGMKKTWTGLRPSDGEGVETLAEGRYWAARPHVIGLKSTRDNRWWKKITRWLRLNEIQLPYGSALKFQSEQTEEKENWKNVKLANAWFKNYCKDKPETGFLRLWDTSHLERIIDLNELLGISQKMNSLIKEQ